MRSFHSTKSAITYCSRLSRRFNYQEMTNMMNSALIEMKFTLNQTRPERDRNSGWTGDIDLHRSDWWSIYALHRIYCALYQVCTLHLGEQIGQADPIDISTNCTYNLNLSTNIHWILLNITPWPSSKRCWSSTDGQRLHLGGEVDAFYRPRGRTCFSLDRCFSCTCLETRIFVEYS